MSPPKKRPPGFIKTALIGAVLVVVPVGIVAFALWQVGSLIFGLIAPVFDQLPLDSASLRVAAIVAAVLALVLICYFIGLAVRTRLGARLRGWVERRLLEKLPGYSTIRSLAHQYIGEADDKKFRPVLVALHDPDTRVVALEIEDLPDGNVAVFVPSSPAVTIGQVHIVPEGRIYPVDAGMHAAIEALAMFGEGSSKLVGGRPSGSA